MFWLRLKVNHDSSQDINHRKYAYLSFFRTLAALSGKKYVSVTAEKAQSKIGKEPVSVNPSKVIDEVRKIVHAKVMDLQL